MPELIDPATPDDAKSRKGFDGEDYELVFSDEFEVEGRSFYPGALGLLLLFAFHLPPLFYSLLIPFRLIPLLSPCPLPSAS